MAKGEFVPARILVDSRRVTAPNIPSLSDMPFRAHRNIAPPKRQRHRVQFLFVLHLRSHVGCEQTYAIERLALAKMQLYSGSSHLFNWRHTRLPRSAIVGACPRSPTPPESFASAVYPPAPSPCTSRRHDSWSPCLTKPGTRRAPHRLNEAKKAGQDMTAPQCPHCCTGQGRWIESPDLRHTIDDFICVTCGDFWAPPMTTPVRVGDMWSRPA